MMLVMLCAFSQESFEITKVGNTYSLEQIKEAFIHADLCGSYYNSKRNILELNDGSVVELKSKEELASKGITIAPSCFIEDNVHYVKAIWSINELGMIMKGFDNSAYPTEKEYYHFNHINKQ